MSEPVRSPRNPRIAAAAALHDAKERRRSGLHLAEGVRVLREAAASGGLVEVFHTSGHRDVVAEHVSGARATEVDERVMARLSDAATPPGVLAVVRTPVVDPHPPRTGPLLVLDGVSDPGNVGTLVRSAAAFGAPVLCLGGADPFGPKAVRASAGSCYRTPIHRPLEAADLAVGLRGAGRPILGLAADGTMTLAEAAAADAPHGVVLVVGSEPHGLGATGRAVTDTLVRIPMVGGVESLNVAAAGAIALHALLGS